MSSTRTQLCIAYAAVALLALLATWHQNLAYFGPESGNPIAATARFWRETFATPASASITLDIGLFLLAATLWMVVEARRLGIRFVWLYVVGGLLVAISVTFPLFLIARELRLRAPRPDATPDSLTRADTFGLAAVAALVVGLSLWSLVH